MRRGDAVVLSVSIALATIAVAIVAFSVFVLDRASHLASTDSSKADSSLLVVGWAPSLCRVSPVTVGCQSGRVSELGSTFILHGLWPQPPANQYCGVPESVADQARNTHGSTMPAVQLTESVRTRLQPLMSDVSVMTSHEWYAHGTCSGVGPDEYFSDSAVLAEQVRKVLDPVFKAAQGNRVTLSTVRSLFDSEFGKGAGERVDFLCRNVIGKGNVIFEVQLSLPRVRDLAAADAVSLKDVLVKGPVLAGRCRGARVL
ncbi:MAG: ribonuclease T(2) [Mycobacteriaceae bacterium]|nr:ribonuclease T(2) [Mycobacteriaceae bacterium]